MRESTSPNGASPKRARARRSPAKTPAVPQQTTAPDSASSRIEIGAIRLTLIDRQSMIATAAYYRAERRRFEAGHELEDWLGAEADIDALLRAQFEGEERNGSSV